MDQQSFTFAEAPAGADTPENPQQEGEQQQRPEGLPEKFNSVADMAKSYQELESKLGAPAAEEQPEAAAAESTEAVEAVENIIGVDAFSKYSTEYVDNAGKLSEESYAEIQEKYNFSKELVDSFIRGQEALTSKDLNEVYSEVGGQEQYDQFIAWASENLPDSDVQSYNDTVNNADMSTIKLALRGLYSSYAKDAGVSPSLLQGTGKASAGGYESKGQMIADMGKPEYKTDSAFRDQVERKLAATPDGIL